MATIRKRRDKWQVQVRRKGQPNQSCSFTIRADALEWARYIEREADRSGLPNDRRALERLTVADITKRYRDEVLPQKRGGENQAIILNAFLRSRLAETPLSAIDAHQFARYRDERLKVVKPSTIIRELGLIQRVFEVARKEWAIALASNPVREIEKPTTGPARTRRLEGGEWDRLLKAAKRTRNRLLLPLVRFALETGMRRSELLNAKWQHVNWQARTLYIALTKNGCPRFIPLTEHAIELLNDIRSMRRNEENVFPLSIEAVKLSWRRLTKRAGLEDLHFHDLRHEAISRFFERGLTVPEVALISGHKDARMLFRYTHLRAEDVARKLNGHTPVSCPDG